MKRGRHSMRATFAIPALLAVLSLVGLVSALTGDGWRDAVSWVALGIPVVTVIWAGRARRS